MSSSFSQYTWNGDRLWRKNRRVNPGSSCMGVDINRNYNDHWGGVSCVNAPFTPLSLAHFSLSLSLTSLCQIGSSNSACSEAYRGESAASEPETQATMQYFKYAIFQVVLLYIKLRYTTIL